MSAKGTENRQTRKPLQWHSGFGHEAVEPSKSEGEKRWRDATNMARLRDSGLLDLAGKKR